MDKLFRAYLLLLAFTQIAAGDPAINCTFSRVAFGYIWPDYTFCMFSQTLMDNFQWSLANSDTSTAGTGPSADHGSYPQGHYAYIESSFKNDGNYARLTSPTYTKKFEEAGGCVQFYYHMYGADIGTLNVSVYDNTQSGLVANWQRSGSQANQWLRADINLSLPPGRTLNMQLVIDAYTKGAYASDNKGDIAIDDVLVYTSGDCSQASETAPTALPTTPTTTGAALPSDTTGTTGTTVQPTWLCNFEGLNKMCGITTRSYGARFSVGSRSFNPNTGPTTDHTGSGHFLWMMGIGVTENSSAIAETRHFDQSYHCFTFWYHMFGDGVGQLRVAADVNGISQELWSQSGNQGNSWKMGRVSLPRGAVKVILTAVRGSTANSDIALDDLSLLTTDCRGVTVPTVITTTPKRPTTDADSGPIVAMACNFDKDGCNLYQDKSADFEWKRINGPTYTTNTGPDADHTQGNFEGYYMYLPSNYKTNGTKARLQSGLIDVTYDLQGCLKFSYHMYGAQMGTLNVRVKYVTGEVVKAWTISGDQGNQWKQAALGLVYKSTETQAYLEFEGTVEHDLGSYKQVRGEMAIDDVVLVEWASCTDFNYDRVTSPVTVATTGPTTRSTLTPAIVTTPTSTPTPPTTTPTTTQTTIPPSVMNCTFDNFGTCGYQQATDDNFDWQRLNSKTWSSDTGPSSDHTSGNGYFMYIEASYKNHDTYAMLVTPTFTKLSDSGCLVFWYHMWGQDMGNLTVRLRKAALSTDIFIVSGDQGNVWKSASIPIDLSGSSTFKIQFVGSVAHQYGDYADVLGDIAIDDVSVDRQATCFPRSVTTPISTPADGPISTPTVGPKSTPVDGSISIPTVGLKSTLADGPISIPTVGPKSTPTDGPPSKPVSIPAGGPGNDTVTAANQKGEDAPSNNIGLIVGVVVAGLIVLVAVVLVGAIYLRKKQLWPFAPGTKMSVMFSRQASEATKFANEEESSDGNEYTVEPSLVFNGNNLHHRAETTDA